MQHPNQWDLKQLKRAVQFLSGSPRIVQRFESQDMPQRVTGFSDTDHAGFLRTRKSNSCSMIFFGRHLLKSSSSTQGVIALSSGESEFYGAVKTASIGLGMISLLKNMGLNIHAPLDEQLAYIYRYGKNQSHAKSTQITSISLAS